MKLSFSLLLLVPVALGGCTKDVQQTVVLKPFGCDSSGFTFTRDIRPIIMANCSGPTCHSGGNANYDFRTYEVTAGRIRTGRWEERLLLPANDPLHMPSGRNLVKCDLFKLRGWIYQGFKNN